MRTFFHNFLYIICIYASSVTAQTITSTIVDKNTLKPIPYATVVIGSEGIITNEEGNFTISIANTDITKDSLHISSMGYEKTSIAVANPLDSILYIAPKAFELKSVFISNKNLSVSEIIDNVKDNIATNYRTSFSKSKLFFRETNATYVEKMDVDFKKSTIKEVDRKLVDSMSRVVPKNSAFYIEALCDLYGNTTTQKLHIIKGARLYDKRNSGSMVSNLKKMEQIFRDNVKPDSYIKFRSGLFSQKISVDSILSIAGDTPSVAGDVENTNSENFFFKSRKINLKNLFEKLFFQPKTKLDVIRKSGKYDFEKTDFTILDDVVAYVIKFKPKRSADFEGTLYVNTQDFAVMRIDYTNIKPLRSFKLLGVTYAENGYSGTTIYTKGQDGKYGVRLIEKIIENKFGVDRPLSVIEKNKHVRGRRKQNQVSLNLDIINHIKNKYEIIVFNNETITESTYNSTQENKNVTSTYMASYDPNFWKGHTIIEPNTAIKQFKSVAQTDDASEEEKEE